MEFRTKSGTKEFQCAVCKKWFVFDEELDKEARRECLEIWGVEPDDTFNINCDDCQKFVNPTSPQNKDLYSDALSKLSSTTSNGKEK